MEAGKGGTVERDAELDPFWALNEIGDKTPVIDVCRREQFVREVDVSRIPYFVDDTTHQRYVG
jgi:hypothetical protein